MKKPSKKELLVSGLCLLFGVTLMGSAIWYKTNKATVTQIPSLTGPNIATAEVAPVPQKAQPYSLKKQESPFSSLNAQKPTGNPAMPPMPSVPVSLSGASSAAPKKIEVADSSTGRKGLHVTSVFMGSTGKNMAVLSDGKVQVTAREGQSNKFGSVSGISKEGLYLDGTFIEVRKDVPDPVESVVAVNTASPQTPAVVPFVPPATQPTITSNVVPATVPAPSAPSDSSNNPNGRKM